MRASVKIMNIEVDMIGNDVLMKKAEEYLDDAGLNVILFASTKMLERAVEDEQYREWLGKADLFLPGERALLAMHHVDVLEAGDMVVSCRSMELMLEAMKDTDKTLFIIAENTEMAGNLRRYSRKWCPGLKVVGTYAYEETVEDAAVINEINSHTPDMLLVDLPVGLQEEWLHEHSATLNARLCIAVGGVSDMMLAFQKEIPGWVGKLHLNWLYRRLFREGSVKGDVREVLFRKKVKKYNDENKIHDYTQDGNE